jgi:4-diphosphocytidyl-2-C-methyl-D-erythritol kinase
MTLLRLSGCKVNLLLNILHRRPDGFHELETVMQPVPLCDELTFTRHPSGVELSCNDAQLPVDAGNLVHRAATAFLAAANCQEGVRIRLEKRIPLAAGLGGGSGNAATTLLALNELFGQPLTAPRLHELAATLGSDVPFFLQTGPALATGRGEQIEPQPPFPALRGTTLLLIHPGFGIATAWAYRQLACFPDALHGQPGRARQLVERLQDADLSRAGAGLYNSLEAPALDKYPILAIYQEFLREHGAAAALMSGSGSTTFALFTQAAGAEAALERFKSRFGDTAWTALIPLDRVGTAASNA